MKKIILASLLVATIATSAFAAPADVAAAKKGKNNVISTIVINDYYGHEVTCTYAAATLLGSNSGWSCAGQHIKSVVLTTNAGGTITATANAETENDTASGWTTAFVPRTPTRG